MSDKYIVSYGQLGFQRMVGTECSMARDIANIHRMKFTAIYDLKIAYCTVLQNILMSIVREKLNAEPA